MTQTESGRNPLGQIPRPISQELLGQIRIDQPLTDLSVEHGDTGEQMGQHLLHLIIAEPLPFHAHQPTNRLGQKRVAKGEIQKENLRDLAILPGVDIRRHLAGVAILLTL
jgi:hypothetical protein